MMINYRKIPVFSLSSMHDFLFLFDQEIAGLFQNLISFEHACPRFGNYITAYTVFWSQFSGTPEDVVLLTERSILVHHVSSDAEIANLFMKLGECVEFDFNCDHYFKYMYHLVEVQYQNQRSLLRKFLGSITSKINLWASH